MNFMELLSKYYAPGLTSFILTFCLVLVSLKLFPKLKLMDRPKKYGLDRAPIPYYGGLAIYIAFLISVFIFVKMTPSVIGLLVASSMIMLVGFFDDLLNIKPVVRLIFQSVAGAVLAVSGVYILSINLPFFGAVSFDKWFIVGVPVLSAIFTILWVMTITNVMNFLDGVSGLTSGVSFIAGITLFLLSTNAIINTDLAAQSGTATIGLIVGMSALAFLIFDFPKPKLLMGDTGSTFLGFVLATLAIFSGGKVATAFLVLGIPILDVIWVVLRRIFSGQKFWKGDLKHLHHRFLSAGMSQKQVVVLYLVVAAIFGFSAVMLVSTLQKFFMLIGLIVLMLLLGVAVVFIPKGK